jgi:uncharacterized protein (TIGR02001 family)
MKLLTASAAAALALGLTGLASQASAQDVDVSFNAAVTSDYVYRGVSQTNEEAALQGGVDLTIGKFYAGAWASNVDFGDNTEAEVDVYGGFRTEAAGFAWDTGVIFYTYAPGANGDYDFIEFKAAASRAFGPVTAGAAVYYSPDFFGIDGAATYGEINAAITPIENLTLNAAVGKQWLDVSDNYTTWNIGATYAFAGTPLALDVRYHDTDVDNVPIYDGRVAATLKVAF